MLSLENIDMFIYVTQFAKRDLFDRFFKIEFSSHSSATGIALNGDLIRAYHTVQLKITSILFPIVTQI